MRNFFLLIMLSLPTVSLAERVHSISWGAGDEPHLVRFENGLVELVSQDDEARLKALEVMQMTPMMAKSSLFENASGMEALMQETEFSPSVVSESQLQSILNGFNSNMRRRSECSDRAHVWAWDEFQRNGTKSEKAFLFLTDSYIRRHRYKWWFHVAPMFTVSNGQKMVMDYQFFDRPITLDEWKNTLVFSKRECVLDFSFLAYDAGADQTQDCYMKTLPMYYRLPADISALERGNPRTDWNTSEVNSARARAFHQGGF